MRPYRILPFLILFVATLLAACDALGQSAPTPEPMIIIASPAPPETAPVAPPRATSGAAAQPTTGAAKPTAVPSGPAPTVAAGSPSKGTVTFAFDAFPTYYPGIIMEVQGLLKQRGYDLKLVP